MTPALPRHIIHALVTRALEEDLGGRGDVTSLATIPADRNASFVIRSRANGVLAGQQPADACFDLVDRDVAVTWRKRDGDILESGDVVAIVEGPALGILTAERPALNFLGRMSGIATLTRQYVTAIADTGAVIAHTRKTTPGLRAVELQAVRAGGGAYHRYGLDDAILIKDNHVAVCGSVSEAVKRARAFAGHMTRVAVEVDRLDQLEDALSAGAESVLLDNFSLDDLRAAVLLTDSRANLEASGGVNLDTVRAIAETGVDVISVGALTHSAPNFDLGLDER
ncbi:carboxylating nicotinate-nucleotide diphosphorylase [Oceanicaulis sp. LC35]|uniref:carboxylating nicotinate-nucleotide diphosphorylase n=1 Tax=Oceanicaulis sp. LC35 TaxID=3349635 RepID=UPI003F848AB8